MRKTIPTGYWTFMCNPRIWEADRYLASGVKEDSWRIIPYQKNWFEVGQLGVIRVGVDGRTKKELNGRPRMQAGVYAIVEVISPPEIRQVNKPQFYLHASPKKLLASLRVGIRIISNLLKSPVLFSYHFEDERILEDPYLIKGFQGASMPLHPLAFQRILEITDFN